MDQIDLQTVLIVAGGVTFLIALSLVRSAARRKPKRSSSTRKGSRPRRTSERGRPADVWADDLLELAQQAGVKPARTPDGEVGRVANVSPSAAIPLAWGPVERSIERAVERLAAKSDDPDLDSIVEKLRFLESKGRFSEEEARVLHEMRMLRNRAAHDELSTDDVDTVAARAYGRVAKALLSVVDKIR